MKGGGKMENNPTHKAKTFNGEWIEGWYDGYEGHIRTDELYYIDRTTLCRSTYRVDSNGKMMYEGDEVEVKFFIEFTHRYKGNWFIKYDDVRCRYLLESVDGKLTLYFDVHDKYTLTGKNKND
jgi:hypothetical protein